MGVQKVEISELFTFLHVLFPVKLNFSISFHFTTSKFENFDIRVIHYLRRDGHCRLITLTMPIQKWRTIFKFYYKRNYFQENKNKILT